MPGGGRAEGLDRLSGRNVRQSRGISACGRECVRTASARAGARTRVRAYVRACTCVRACVRACVRYAHACYAQGFIRA